MSVKLAKMILALDKAARDQGLYVGAGICHDLPDTPAAQEGPKWKALKREARNILMIEEEDK